MQELNGYIKLYRKLIQWGWYQDSVVKDLFLHLLLTASFKDFEWMGRQLKAGQLITSRKKLVEELGFTEQQIRTAMEKLKSTKEITSETTNKYTIITVVNWEDYQSDEKTLTSNLTNEQPANCVNKLLTSTERLKNSTNKSTSKNGCQTIVNSGVDETKKILSTSNSTNEQPTNNQQTTNKQPHRKNVKNVKNVKNSSDGAGAAPQLSEILSFIFENRLMVNGMEFYKRYSENGWKTESGKSITDWKRMLKVWDRRERESKPTYADGYAGVKSLTDD